MGAALFIIGNLAAVAVAWLISGVLFGGDLRWRRWLAALALYPVVILLVVLGLGTFGKLSAVTAVAAMVGLAVAAGASWLLAKRRGNRAQPNQLAASPGTTPPWPTVMGVMLLAGVAAPLLIRSVLGGVGFHPDDLIYHAPVPAHWMIDGGFKLSLMNPRAYYPLNAATLTVWTMLPFGGDAYANLSALYWVVLLAASAGALARLLGASRSTSALVAATVLAAPDLVKWARSFAGVDLAGPAMMLAAVAMASPSSESDRRPGLAGALMAGLLGGYAVGVKVTFALPCLLLGLWLIVGAGRGRPSRRVAGLVVLLIGAAVTGSYWYIRNWVTTGNPVFPAAVGPFSGPFGPAEQQQTKLISRICDRPGDVGMWLYLLRWAINWPMGLFVLSAGGYLAGLWWRLRRATVTSVQARSVLGLLLVVGLLAAAQYPLMPFSGSIDAPDAELYTMRRYVVLPFVIGLALIAPVFSGAWAPWAWGVAVLAIATAWPSDVDLFPAMAAMLAVFVTVGLWRPWRRLAKVRSRGVLVAGGIVVVSVGLAGFAPRKQGMANGRLGIYDGIRLTQPATQGLRQLEQLPDGSRLTWFSAGPRERAEYYPFFGRRLTLRPVVMQPDGTPYTPLHERWQRDPAGTIWWPPVPDVNAAELIDHLRAADVQYVFVTAVAGQWPEHQGILADCDSAHLMADGDGWALWSLTNPQSP